jgi:hypothetical protein
MGVFYSLCFALGQGILPQGKCNRSFYCGGLVVLGRVVVPPV